MDPILIEKARRLMPIKNFKDEEEEERAWELAIKQAKENEERERKAAQREAELQKGFVDLIHSARKLAKTWIQEGCTPAQNTSTDALLNQYPDFANSDFYKRYNDFFSPFFSYKNRPQPKVALIQFCHSFTYYFENISFNAYKLVDQMNEMLKKHVFRSPFKYEENDEEELSQEEIRASEGLKKRQDPKLNQTTNETTEQTTEEQARQTRLAEEQAAQEQAERTRLAEAQAAAQEQARQTRLAEEQAAQEQAEQTRLAEAQAAAQEQARQARLAEEQAAQEQAEQTRLAEAQAAAQEQARQARIAEEQTAAQEQARQARIAEEQTSAQEQARQARIAEEQTSAQEQARQARLAEEQAAQEQAHQARLAAEQLTLRSAQRAETGLNQTPTVQTTTTQTTAVQNTTVRLEPQKTSTLIENANSARQEPKQPGLNKNQPRSSKVPLTMMVLGGFIAACGIVTIALAFTLLSTLSLGIPVGFALGFTALIGGIGLFTSGLAKSKKEKPEVLQDEIVFKLC